MAAASRALFSKRSSHTPTSFHTTSCYTTHLFKITLQFITIIAIVSIAGTLMLLRYRPPPSHQPPSHGIEPLITRHCLSPLNPHPPHKVPDRNHPPNTTIPPLNERAQIITGPTDLPLSEHRHLLIAHSPSESDAVSHYRDALKLDGCAPTTSFRSELLRNPLRLEAVTRDHSKAAAADELGDADRLPAQHSICEHKRSPHNILEVAKTARALPSPARTSQHTLPSLPRNDGASFHRPTPILQWSLPTTLPYCTQYYPTHQPVGGPRKHIDGCLYILISPFSLRPGGRAICRP